VLIWGKNWPDIGGPTIASLGQGDEVPTFRTQSSPPNLCKKYNHPEENVTCVPLGFRCITRKLL